MKLDPLLKLIGSTPPQINSFFENWHLHSENERLNVIRSLRSLGQLSAQYKTTKSKDDFKCPLYNFSVIKPCNLKNCAYYLTPKYSDSTQVAAVTACSNCLIRCLDIAKNNRMSANEASTILGLSISEINVANTMAIAKVRRAKIKEQIEKYQLPKFKYLEGHCIQCEQYMQDELDISLWPELVIEPGKHGWCSSSCRDKKPKWQFLIEKEFECNYLFVIATGVLVYKNFESLGSIFGINKDIMLKIKADVQINVEILQKYFVNGV